MAAHQYKIFVSHGSDDSWVAAQIARRVREVGAETFLDETNIPKGANFKRIIHEEIEQSRELIALFTPWSSNRAWVWIEIGAAWIQNKPVVAVFYGMDVSDLEESGHGKGILEDINILRLTEIERYFTEVAARVNEASHA